MSVTRRGDWTQTFSGRQFWPLDPRADEVFVEDVAHALALQCRFGGACREFYSVAEHSVRVADEVARVMRTSGCAAPRVARVAFAALLHDAAEAYLVDVPRPIKAHLAGYRELEADILAAVRDRFGVVPPGVDERLIRYADEALLATEARDLMAAPPAAWTLRAHPLPARIEPLAPRAAEARFLRRFDDLQAEARS